MAQVVEQKIRHAVVGHENVHQAIAVIIRHGHAHSFAQLRAQAGGFGDVGESAVVVVAEELVGRVVVGFGVAVERLLGRAAGGFQLGVPLHVVGDHQVQPAIVIDVHPCGGNRPQLAVARIHASQARLGGDILERAVAAIVVQNVAVHAGHEDIRMAVVIVIGYRDSHGVAFARHAGFFRNVGKRAVAIVAEQAVGKFRAALFQRRHLRAVGEENVHAAVVVVIQRGHAAQHQFGLVKLAGGAVAQLELRPGLAGSILEPDLCPRAARRQKPQRQCDCVRR